MTDIESQDILKQDFCHNTVVWRENYYPTNWDEGGRVKVS